MARPRKASDEQIFQAAFRVMQRLGPAEWTLADVAEEAGLTAGALVQRFGSKRRLQLALTATFARTVPQLYEALRARHDSPLGVLRGYADHLGKLASSRRTLAHHLDYLRLDLADAQMHVHFRRQAAAARAFIEQTVQEAISRGELRTGADPALVARLIEAVLTGSLFTWAAARQERAADHLRRNLDDLLRLFAPSRPTASTPWKCRRAPS